MIISSCRGEPRVSAQLQFARAVARRAERRLWTLNREDSVPEDILRFINRLSDLFFVMARMEMQPEGTGGITIWKCEIQKTSTQYL